MRSLRRALAAALVLLLSMGLGGWWWTGQALPLRGDRAEVSIEPGTPPREVARLWVAAGVDVPENWLYLWFRISGQARMIRAGSYEIDAGSSPRLLLDRMVRGEQVLESLRLIEGWSFRQVREALARAPRLRHTVDSLSEAEVAVAVGRAEGKLEGWLFPDTYVYSPGVTDILVLRRAANAMQRRLSEVWALRNPDSPLQTPEQLLVLASVVEKETGNAADRGQIAGVFNNRLRLGMPLQSDPTVIYGLGERFDGNLRKADLQADSPWNTYTRRGLPVTPIAMPGLASLRAAAQPEATQALYFVARGDGRSAFSASLVEHNRAVNQYQRSGRP